MPNIHTGPLLHVPRGPTPPPKSGWAKFTGKAKAKHQARSAKFAQKAQRRTGNWTSTRATRYKGEGKFGQRTSEQKDERSERRFINTKAAMTGATLGSIAAMPLGIGGTKRDTQIAANKKKLEKRFIPRRGPKETVHLITDVGTKAAEMKPHHPGRWGLGAMAGGAGLTAVAETSYKKGQKKTLASQRAQLAAKKPVSKARLMSDAEIKHRKKVQGHVSQATGALGLAALGGTLAASRGGRTALRKIPKLEHKIKAPGPKDPDRDKIKGAINPILATSAGLGGLGSFNFASYTGAESRKRNMQPVKKDYGMDPGYFGEVGRQITDSEIEEEIAKAWEPVASKFDSERSRHKRATAYQAGAIGTSGALAGGAAAFGGQSLSRHARANEMAGKPKRPQSSSKVRALKAGSKVAGKRAGGLALASAAAAGGAVALKHRKKSESWQSYGKRDSTSAFGVDHA